LRKDICEGITKKLYILYGANEIGQITTASYGDIKKHPFTVGKVEFDIELKIMNPKGRACAPGKSGFIAVKTSPMITEYYSNPEATQKHFHDGYFYPGDIGRLTADGQLIFEGRADDMMVYSGANVYPIEIESVLEEHPDVEEAAVFPLLDADKNHYPCAVVKLLKKVKEKELMEWCVKFLGWKHPVRIFTVDRMPRNHMGKILKRELTKQVYKILSG